MYIYMCVCIYIYMCVCVCVCVKSRKQCVHLVIKVCGSSCTCTHNVKLRIAGTSKSKKDSNLSKERNITACWSIVTSNM